MQPPDLFETAATIHASPEAVMAWWFHPDRKDDLQTSMDNVGAHDFLFANSDTDGVRVRTAEWTDRRGWKHHHQIEAHLAPNGVAERQNDRFVAPISDVVTYRRPGGDNDTRTMACNGRIEFISLAGGDTEVRAFHSHTLTGWPWLQRSSRRKAFRKNTESLFVDSVDRCRAATTSPIGGAQS
jgi:hypothetical protein